MCTPTKNQATIGDNVLQPGVYDGGVDTGDAIGTLFDYESITFTGKLGNTLDAAIALSSTDDLGNATPHDGYGLPMSDIVSATVGQAVQKFGRTTLLTTGTVTATNAKVRVSYGSGIAGFKNQIIVEDSAAFIGGGDSGSLLVTDPGRDPVGLLFAGNSAGTFAVANRIDLVLDRFNLSIDGEAPAEPDEVSSKSV